MGRNNRVTARLMGTAAALATVVASGILAPAASAATPRTPPPGAQGGILAPAASITAHGTSSVRPLTIKSCGDQLKNFGYVVTPARATACAEAATDPNPIRGVGICIGLLKLTGVGFIAAPVACGSALASGYFQEEEWCYNNGGYACLNAWSGGPFVNVYRDGPETTDTHQYIALMYNESTGYYELVYTGSQGDSGQCIGDANNDPTLADAGLVGCGTASGNQGWGTNMAWGTNGCPAGEAWFYDYHWNGYLGPPDNYVNGSHFYLNKPDPLCFALTTVVFA